MTTDLVPIQANVPSVFEGRKPPEEVVKFATSVANALIPIVKSRKLAVKIGTGEHIRVEAWTACGAMLNLFASIEQVWDLRDGDDWGYGARAAIRDPEGRQYGAAEAECWASEDNWGKKDRFELKSMAQTRAVSKAFRMPLSWIVVLAGYEATPAEEMTSVARRTTTTVAPIRHRTGPPQPTPAPVRPGQCPDHPNGNTRAWKIYVGQAPNRVQVTGRKCTAKVGDGWCDVLLGDDGYTYRGTKRIEPEAKPPEPEELEGWSMPEEEEEEAE
jgi:hypothetical protein